MNFGLLKFCLEHSDDPSSLTKSQIDPNRDPKDYEFLLAALNNLESDMAKAYKLIEKLENSQDAFEIKACLEGLQYYCEDIDIAQGMLKKQGMELVLRFLNHADCEIRYLAAWVLASTLQSNVLAQSHAIKINAMESLLEVLKNEDNTNAAGKQLYALTSFLSENPLASQIFVGNCNGINVLHRYIVEQTQEAAIPLKSKAIWMLGKLVFNLPSAVSLICETSILQSLSKSLQDDQNITQIRKNIIALLHRLAKTPEGLPLLRNFFKDTKLVAIDESLCGEEELEEYKFLKASLQ